MRAGKSITVSLADRRRLENLIDDRNVAQKYVWRAEIVLFTADGAGTNEITRRTCKSKTCVWRWQERFLEEGFEGFIWDEDRRLRLRAKLDAVYFHLYGVTDRDDVRYIYSTFPIVEREEKAAYDGRYRSCELCLAWMSALAAGDPDAEIRL